MDELKKFNFDVPRMFVDGDPKKSKMIYPITAKLVQNVLEPNNSLTEVLCGFVAAAFSIAAALYCVGVLPLNVLIVSAISALLLGIYFCILNRHNIKKSIYESTKYVVFENPDKTVTIGYLDTYVENVWLCRIYALTDLQFCKGKISFQIKDGYFNGDPKDDVVTIPDVFENTIAEALLYLKDNPVNSGILRSDIFEN